MLIGVCLRCPRIDRLDAPSFCSPSVSLWLCPQYPLTLMVCVMWISAEVCSAWLNSLPSPVDAINLQEAHCLSVAECRFWFLFSGYTCLVSPGSARSCGCILLFRPTLHLVRSWSDDAGRYLLAEFTFQDCCFCVLFVYGPNRNPARDLFSDELAILVDPAVPTVLCGDFNTVFERSLDRAGSVVGEHPGSH